MRQLIAVLVVLGCLLIVSPCNAQDDTALISHISQILGEPFPTKIIVERVSQKQLRDWLRSEQMRNCRRQYPRADPRFCNIDNDDMLVFIFGRWVEESDSGIVHLVIYNEAGTDTLIHEFLHWWLHNKTTPKGFLNTHPVVFAMTNDIITSRAFTKWLEKEE